MEKIAHFGVSFLPASVQETVSWCQLAEDRGFARLGIGDSPSLFRDPWISLGAVARATQTVPVGIWVTNPTTRHPLVTANAAATLAELAPDRICIGIGTGDSAAYNAGYNPAKLAQVEAYINAVRELIAVGQTEYEGRRALLTWLTDRRPIPIYLAAHGERSIRLAGRIADGVIIDSGITPEAVDGALQHLRDGAAESGRSIDDIDVWWYVRYLVMEEEGAARLEMAGMLAENAHVIAAGIRNDPRATEALPAIQKLASEYDMSDYGKTPMDARHRYAQRAFELGVADFLLDRYCFAGTPPECVTQVEKAVSAGARQFTCSMRGPDREGQLANWSGLVVAALPEQEADAVRT